MLSSWTCVALVEKDQLGSALGKHSGDAGGRTCRVLEGTQEQC